MNVHLNSLPSYAKGLKEDSLFKNLFKEKLEERIRSLNYDPLDINRSVNINYFEFPFFSSIYSRISAAIPRIKDDKLIDDNVRQILEDLKSLEKDLQNEQDEDKLDDLIDRLNKGYRVFSDRLKDIE